MTIACIDFGFFRRNVKQWLASSVTGLFLGGLTSGFILYFLMPPLIFIWIIGLFFSMMFFGCLIRTISMRIDDMSLPSTLAIIASAIIVLLILMGGLFTPMIYAKELHRIPNIVEAEEEAAIISIEHIRTVPYETAIWKADKAVGRLGYKAGIDEAHIQFRDNELKWLCPLDYNGLWRSFRYREEGLEGYVKVSAEKYREEPEKVFDLHLHYIPSAVLSYRLERHIYFSYPNYLRKESVFQLGEHGQPIYVTMLTKPTILGITGEKPVKVIETDPQSGEIKSYNMDQVPDYIQRVMDEELAEKYLEWWGKFIHGYFNAIRWAKRTDMKVPTGGISYYHSDTGQTTIAQSSEADVYLTYAEDGRLYWFSSITTPGEDTSMVSYVMYDVKSWPLSGKEHKAEGFFNDIGAAKNIQQDPDVSKVSGFKVAQPIKYQIEGYDVWIAPVLSSQNEVKEFGVTQARGGATFVAEELDPAINEWKTSVGLIVSPEIEKEIDKNQLIEEIKVLLSQVNEKIEQLEEFDETNQTLQH